ncbi:hypothetical protein HPB47_007336, partial [Ixodes persulcatus]
GPLRYTRAPCEDMPPVLRPPVLAEVELKTVRFIKDRPLNSLPFAVLCDETGLDRQKAATIFHVYDKIEATIERCLEAADEGLGLVPPAESFWR